MLITILNWPKDAECIHCSGLSSKEYPFRWNTKAGRYEYPPKSQAEIDDIFQSQGVGGFFFYAPVLGAGDASAAIALTPRPTIERRQYDDLTRVELVALCKDCGFTPRAADDEATIKRLLDAYFLGAGLKATLPEPPKAAPKPADDDVPVEAADVPPPAPVAKTPTQPKQPPGPQQPKANRTPVPTAA
jgi:hypothetical protein